MADISNVTMSLASMPCELLSQIFENLGDTNEPYQDDKRPEPAKTLMALRLTAKRLNPIAARQLFRHFFLVISSVSWTKLLRIAQHRDFANYLRGITIETRDLTPCHRWTDTPESALELSRPDSFSHQYIDFSWFPNLKSIECSKWRAVKTGYRKLPAYKCVLHCPVSRDEWILWYYLSCMNIFSSYGFEIRSLNLNLASHFTWKSRFGVNAKGVYPRYLLPAIQDLPNIRIFKLDQSRYFDLFLETEKRRITNIVGLLRNKSWPRLRRVEFRNLVTKVADLEAFLMPHQGMLESVDRAFLSRIIRYAVKPAVFRDWNQLGLQRLYCCNFDRPYLSLPPRPYIVQAPLFIT